MIGKPKTGFSLGSAVDLSLHGSQAHNIVVSLISLFYKEETAKKKSSREETQHGAEAVVL